MYVYSKSIVFKSHFENLIMDIMLYKLYIAQNILVKKEYFHIIIS